MFFRIVFPFVLLISSFSSFAVKNKQKAITSSEPEYSEPQKSNTFEKPFFPNTTKFSLLGGLGVSNSYLLGGFSLSGIGLWNIEEQVKMNERQLFPVAGAGLEFYHAQFFTLSINILYFNFYGGVGIKLSDRFYVYPLLELGISPFFSVSLFDKEYSGTHILMKLGFGALAMYALTPDLSVGIYPQFSAGAHHLTSTRLSIILQKFL